MIEIDDLQAQMLADQFVEIADGLAANLRCRNEAAHAEVDEHAALDDLRDGRFDHLVCLVRRDDLFPGLECACAPLRKEERPVLVVDPVNHHLELVADVEFLGIDGEREFPEAEDAFRFSADVDEEFVLILRDDDAGQYLALIEDLQALLVHALFECELVLQLFGGLGLPGRFDVGGSDSVPLYFSAPGRIARSHPRALAQFPVRDGAER